MSDLASVTTLQELIDFLSDFLETVPTQDYVDQELAKKVGLDLFGATLPKYVTGIEFNQRMAAKASKTDLIGSVSSKADRNEVSSGIARKANLNGLYLLESKLNRLFPFKCVENIDERNLLEGEDLDKVVLVFDASGDKRRPGNSLGAIYTYSKIRREWLFQSELTYNAEQISYNKILGKPSSSAKEIDMVVGAVIEKLEYILKLHEIYTKMHLHSKTDNEISSAVDVSHSHLTAPEVYNVADNDLIPIVRDGVVMGVKAHILKEYLK